MCSSDLITTHTWSYDEGVAVTTLPGGVPLLVLQRPGAPLVSFGVFQRGGSCLEVAADEGLARCTAHLLLKGTTTRTAAQIAEATEELGGGIGVSAGLESLGWSMSVPTRHLAAATAILADVLQHPAFPEDAIDTERTLTLAELQRQRDDMGRWPMRLASLAAYQGHPYARAVLGTPESLASFDAARLRAFHRAHILQAASVITVVGDVQPDDVAQLMTQAFPLLTYHVDPPLSAVAWPAQSMTTSESRSSRIACIASSWSGRKLV